MWFCHYNDVIMNTMASQITGVSNFCSTVGSGADQRKHRSPTSLAFVRGIHRSPVNSPHKRPVTQKMFPFDDVIMFLHEPITNISMFLVMFPSIIIICVLYVSVANYLCYVAGHYAPLHPEAKPLGRRGRNMSSTTYWTWTETEFYVGMFLIFTCYPYVYETK